MDPFNLVLGLAFAAVLVLGVVWLLRANQVTIEAGGPGDGDEVRLREVAGLVVPLHIEPERVRAGATVTFDGEDVTSEVERTDTGLEWSPPEEGLEEGTHELALEVPRAVFGSASWSVTFDVVRASP